MKLSLTFAATALIGALSVSAAAAQSVYGCTELDSGNSHPSLEGDRGVFYRISPDMHMFHPFAEETMLDLARLSAALAEQGTTLVYVPVPTKSLAMPDQLPQEALDYGFDVNLATSVYVENLERLQAKSVQVVDIRGALRTAPADSPAIFQTDYRLTSVGARLAAQAIADALGATPGFISQPKSRYQTASSGMVVLPSTMRSALQSHCLISLPEVQTEAFATTRTMAAAGASSGNALLGSTGQSVGGRIALVGTEHTGEPAANLAGFLSEFTGLEVLQYSVTGGGSYAAISSYLTSQEFQQNRPAYLVWMNPIESSLAEFGDQPMAELTAASGSSCRVALPLSPSAQENAVTVDLTTLDPNQKYTLFLDADGAAATTARFDFVNELGIVRTKIIERNPEQVKTGRFYMPLTGLWPQGVQSVDITLDVPIGANAHATACFD